jgi:hypothetical protein
MAGTLPRRGRFPSPARRAGRLALDSVEHDREVEMSDQREGTEPTPEEYEAPSVEDVSTDDEPIATSPGAYV